MKKTRKTEKGEKGYIAERKKLAGLMTLIFFAIVAALYITGLIVCKTRNNILTVIAVLLVLPAAKFAVDWIMILPHKPVDEGLYNAVEEADGKFLHKYECVFTSKERAVYAPALVITDHTMCAYVQDTKTDMKNFREALEKYTEAAGASVKVTLISDEKQFIKKVKLISDSREEILTEEETRRIEQIWHAAECMCL